MYPNQQPPAPVRPGQPWGAPGNGPHQGSPAWGSPPGPPGYGQSMPPSGQWGRPGMVPPANPYGYPQYPLAPYGPTPYRPPQPPRPEFHLPPPPGRGLIRSFQSASRGKQVAFVLGILLLIAVVIFISIATTSDAGFDRGNKDGYIPPGQTERGDTLPMNQQ